MKTIHFNQINVEDMVFDYDQTLVDNGIIMPLLKRLVELQVKKINIWSNGNTWIKDGILESLGIEAVHVDVPGPMEVGIEKYLADFEICQEEGAKIGMAHNVSAPKYTNLLPKGKILVDDLAPLWNRIGGNTITPEEALKYLNK